MSASALRTEEARYSRPVDTSVRLALKWGDPELMLFAQCSSLVKVRHLSGRNVRFASNR